MELVKLSDQNPFKTIPEPQDNLHESQEPLNDSALPPDHPLFQSGQLTNKFFYHITVVYFCSDDFVLGGCMMALPNMIASYGRIFNLDVAQMNIFNFYFITLFSLGMFFGGLLNYKLDVLGNTSYSRFYIRITLVLLFLLCLIEWKELVLGLRFLYGLCLGVLLPCDLGDLFRLSPPKFRKVSGAIIGCSLSLGLTSSMLLTYLESLGWISWKLIYIYLALIQVMALLINFFIHHIDLSYEYALQLNDREKAEKILSQYLTPECVKWMIREEEKLLSLSNRPDQIKGSLFIYYREFIMVCIIYAGLSASFVSNYIGYMTFFMCRDLQNQAEVSVSGLVMTIACCVELITKILTILFPCMIVKRKKTLICGLLLGAILWAAQSYFYYIDNWTAEKIIVVMWMAAIGYFLSPAIYCTATDFLPSELIGVVMSLCRVYDIIMLSIFSFLFPKQLSTTLYWQASLFFMIITIIVIIIIAVYTIESGGLTRSAIHSILTRKNS
jgi:MFS family permease